MSLFYATKFCFFRFVGFLCLRNSWQALNNAETLVKEKERRKKNLGCERPVPEIATNLTVTLRKSIKYKKKECPFLAF